MSRYIHSKDFKRLYPLIKPLSSGGFGQVYESGPDNVVKYIIADLNYLSPALREIDTYRRFDHPCIMKLINYTIYFNRHSRNKLHFLLALPRGIGFFEAIKLKLITKDKAIKDIALALNFLHINNVAHADIKPANCVFHEGRMKLIDFGNAREIISTNQGKMITGVAYTPNYIDPQYNSRLYNPLKVEIYPLGKMSVEAERGNNNIIFGDSPALLPLALRPELSDIFPTTELGAVYETLPIDLTQCSDRDLLNAAILFIEYKDPNYRIQHFFQMMHIFHRCFPLFDSNVKSIAAMCGFLIASMNNLDIRYFVNSLGVSFSILPEILISLDDIIITPTIWDYIPSDDCIEGAIIEITSCNYAYPSFRCYIEKTSGDKNFLVNEKYPNAKKFIENIISKRQKYILLPLVELEPRIHPIEIKEEIFNANLFIEKMDNFDYYKIQGKILYFREQLPTLTVQQGVTIFNTFNNNLDHRMKDLLRWYFSPRLYKLFPKTITRYEVNPFAITSEGKFYEYLFS